MSLFVASLNSGSNGNSYYVGNDKEAVLIDAGLSCREIEKRMRRLNLSLEKVKAVFISHEHDDHIRGVEVLSSRYQLPVYITPTTLKHGKLSLENTLTRAFKGHETISIGDLHVRCFPKTHDAADPHSFVVHSNTVRIGVITDIGFACENVIRHFAACHAAFLEANYDEEMLQKGSYPWPLKNRIRGGQGHISNRQALELFVQYRPAFMSHLFLSHLSKDNNRPELAQALFEAKSENTRIIVASRYEETEVYMISGNPQSESWGGWDAPVAVVHQAAGLASIAAAAGNGGSQPVAAGVMKQRKALSQRGKKQRPPSNVIQISLF